MTDGRPSPPPGPGGIAEGDRCRVVAGTHKGKSGIVRDLNTSKTGHLTITVVQDDGERFKTLAKNVEAEAGDLR